MQIQPNPPALPVPGAAPGGAPPSGPAPGPAGLPGSPPPGVNPAREQAARAADGLIEAPPNREQRALQQLRQGNFGVLGPPLDATMDRVLVEFLLQCQQPGGDPDLAAQGLALLWQRSQLEGRNSRFQPHEVAAARQFAQGTLPAPQALQALQAAPAAPARYEEVVAAFGRGDFAALGDIRSKTNDAFLTRFLGELSRSPHPRGDELEAAAAALAELDRRGPAPGVGPRVFHGREYEIARKLKEDLEGRSIPRHQAIRAALAEYRNFADRNQPASLLHDLAHPERNGHALYYRLVDAERSQALSDPALRQQATEALQSRFTSLGEAGDFSMAFRLLNPEMTGSQWADVVGATVERALQKEPLDRDFLSGSAGEHLKDALQGCASDPAAYRRLLASIRRLCDRVPEQRGRLAAQLDGKLVHGFFLPKRAPEGVPESKTEALLEKLAAGPEDRVLLLRQLRAEGVPAHRLAGFYAEAVGKQGSAAELLAPLLSEPDPEGNIARAFAGLARSADGPRLLGDAQFVRPEKSWELLRLLSQHQDKPAARVAAAEIVSMLARDDTSLRFHDKKLQIDPATAEALATLPPSPSLRRLAAVAMPDSAEARSTMQKLLRGGLRDLPALPADLKLDESNQGRLHEASELYDRARRDDSRAALGETAQELNEWLEGKLGLGKGNWIPTSSLDAPRNLTGPSTHDDPAYLGDFLQAAGALTPERRKELLERLGNAPLPGWGRTPLGWKKDSRPDWKGGREAVDDLERRIEGLTREMATRPKAGQREELERLRGSYREVRYGAQGLTGRMRAASQMGEAFDALAAWAREARVEPKEFDSLLMRAAELKEANPQTLAALIKLKPSARGLGDLLEAVDFLPPDQLRLAVSQPDGLQQVGDLVLRRLRDRAGATLPGLFEGTNPEGDAGERMANLLIRQGRSRDLLLPFGTTPALLDRLKEEGRSRTGSQAMADRLLQQIADDPKATPADKNLARLKLLRYSSRASAADLKALARPLDGLTEPDRTTQHRTNLEIGVALANHLPDRPRTEAGFRTAQAEADDVLRYLEGSLASLPERMAEQPAYGGIGGQLEAARQIAERARLEASSELTEIVKAQKLRQSLELKDGMGFQAVRSLLNLALDSPSDAIFLGVNARAGVGIKVPFVGKVEAFVEGNVGFEVKCNETGQFEVSFAAGVGAGAGLEVRDVAGAEVKVGREGKLTYVFANQDETAKFLTNVMNQLGLTRENPTYDSPLLVQRDTTKWDAKCKLGPVELNVNDSDESSQWDYGVPWLPRGQTQRTDVTSRTRAFSGAFRWGDRSVGLSASINDLEGTRNQADAGMTMTISLDVGVDFLKHEKFAGSKNPETLAFVDLMYECILKNNPGLMRGYQPEEARQRLLEMFQHRKFEVKANAKGKLELQVSCGDNLIRDKEKQLGHTTMFPRQVVPEALNQLCGLLEDAFAEKPKHNWQMQNLRVASELSLEMSARGQWGPLFAEVSAQLKYRNATTLAGSLFHARNMLYEMRLGVPFDELQLKELEKDGFLYGSGPQKGTLNKDAAVITMGRMLKEMTALYDDEKWRKDHLPEGTTREQLAANLGDFLEDLTRSLWAGLRNTGRSKESYEDFRKAFTPERLREAEQFILKLEEDARAKGLPGVSDDRTMEAWKKR